jgi:hypothetical protein
VATSAWLTTFACLILIVSVPALTVSASAMVRALRRLRRSPDDRMARFEYGWEGTFALLSGLASAMSLALILASRAGSSGLALAGVCLVNLLVQPLALLICWVGVRKIVLGIFGQVAYAWRRVPASELASLRQSERRGLAWYCIFQGVILVAWGTAMSVGCAGLLIQAIPT